MSARPVQISIDRELLARIDSDPEVRERGRSAFLRSAVRLYLEAKEWREVDTRLAVAYEGEAEAMLGEVEALLGGRAWPDD